MEHLCWYYVLFILSFGIFLLRGLASLILGEIEFDFDLDGNIDSDLSGLLSFKGLLHFIMGFSSYTSVVGFVHTKSLYVLYNFTVMQYVWAALIGVGLTVLLFYLYKFVMKADHYNNEELNFDGMTGQIAVNEGDGTFQVNVSTHLGVRKVVATHKVEGETLYDTGDYVTLKYDKETKGYIF